MKDFKIPRKEIQIFRNEIQAGRNKFQIRRNEIQIQNPSISFAKSSLIKGLRRPPKATSGLESAAAAWGCSFAWLVCRSFDLRFLFLRSREASEGLAPFLRSRTLGRRLSDWAAGKPHCAKRGTVASSDHRPEDREKKTGRSIRCAARMRPLKRARTGFEPLDSGRAPALHACEYLTIPAFEHLSLRFRPARRKWPLSVGRIRAPFIQRRITLPGFRFPVKKFQKKGFSKKDCWRLSRWLWLASAIAVPYWPQVLDALATRVLTADIGDELARRAAGSLSRWSPHRRRGC